MTPLVPTSVRHRNGCSASTEISVRLQPKRAFAFAEIHKNAQRRAKRRGGYYSPQMMFARFLRRLFR
jgi:hypothetical protein